MQIALTGRLAKALKIKPPVTDESKNPLFTWTANWTTVWSNRKSEELLVLVNNATRFVVAMYQVKRKDLSKIEVLIPKAIRNTLLGHNFNVEMVDEYMRLMGEIEFTKNSNRNATAWVNRAGLECAYYVGRRYNGINKMYNDAIGVFLNYRYVNYSNNLDEKFLPYQKMLKAMSNITGLQPYKSRAFELEISLDLDVYKATRRVVVPATMSLTTFHDVIQRVFDWEDYHLYDYTVYDQKTGKVKMRLVLSEEDLEYDSQAIIMDGYCLEDVFPENEDMIYSYDFGDDWSHHVKLVQILEDFDRELPYLLEASGKTPPEDVGGVGGFIKFLEIMMDSNHPDHEEIKAWAGYWTPDLPEWKKKPKVIVPW